MKVVINSCTVLAGVAAGEMHSRAAVADDIDDLVAIQIKTRSLNATNYTSNYTSNATSEDDTATESAPAPAPVDDDDWIPISGTGGLMSCIAGQPGLQISQEVQDKIASEDVTWLKKQFCMDSDDDVDMYSNRLWGCCQDQAGEFDTSADADNKDLNECYCLMPNANSESTIPDGTAWHCNGFNKAELAHMEGALSIAGISCEADTEPAPVSDDTVYDLIAGTHGLMSCVAGQPGVQIRQQVEQKFAEKDVHWLDLNWCNNKDEAVEKSGNLWGCCQYEAGEFDPDPKADNTDLNECYCKKPNSDEYDTTADGSAYGCSGFNKAELAHMRHGLQLAQYSPTCLQV